MISFEYTLKQSYLEDLQPVVNATDILWINCFIHDDDSIFTVEIQRTRNVSVLKNQIKNSNSAFLNGIDAKNLKLWCVNFSVDDLSAIKCPPDPELENATSLSDIFQPWLDPKYVHVVVEVPLHPRSQHIAGAKLEGTRNTILALQQSGCFPFFFDRP